MNHSDLPQKALDLINLINAAITNGRLYPPGSALIANSVQRMTLSVVEILRETDAVEYGEAEKKLLIQGAALPDKDQKKPQVVSFLRLLAEQGLRSISIKKEATEKELAQFIQVMGTAPDDVKAAGGIKKMFQERQITHIAIDELIYVKMDADRSIMADMALSDRDIAASLLGDAAAEEQDLEKIREMFRDAKVVGRIFKEGVRQILETPEDGEAVSDSIADLIATFKELSGDTGVVNSKEILNTLMEMEDAVLLSAFTRNLDDVFGESVFEEFIESLDNSRVNDLEHRVSRIRETIKGNTAYSASQASAIDHVLGVIQKAAKTKTGSEPPIKSEEKATVPAAPEEPKTSAPPSAPETSRDKRVKLLTAALSGILKGDTDILGSLTDVNGLAAVITQLVEKGKKFTVDAVIEKLGIGLSNENKKIRNTAAELLAKIDERLDGDSHLDQKIELAQKLAQYLKNESEISNVYEKIARQLQQTAQKMIVKEEFETAKEILDLFQGIYTGSLEKNDAIVALSENMLQNISTDAILDILMKDGATEDIDRQKKDIHSLIIMGTTTVERLLDRLYETHNRSERSRIIQVITKIGKPAAPPVEERLRQGGPWFYIRNLVLLLGRLGDPSHLELLESVFTNEDLRVQRETVFAIQAINPAATGKILLRNLYTVGPENMGLLISVIGLLKYADAVPKLLSMLESGSSAIPKKEKNTVMVKICESLGKIGHPDAVDPLKTLSRSKGFLSIMSVDAEVRAAAAAALKAIKRNGK